MKRTCASTACSIAAASSSRPTTRPTASICRPTIAGIIVAWSDLDQGGFRRRLLERPVGLVRSRRRSPRRGLSRRARPVRVRPQGTAAEDAGILGHRRLPTARPRTPNSPTCSIDLGNPDATTLARIQQPRHRRLSELASRPQEPPRRFPTGSNSAATSRSAMTPPTTACGKSTAPAKSFTPEARFAGSDRRCANPGQWSR